MDPLQQLLGSLKPVQKMGMGAYAQELLESVGSGLSENDQIWLSKHLMGLPDYLRTQEGAKVMGLVIDCYRASLKKLDWN